jgi:hypothetical protein
MPYAGGETPVMGDYVKNKWEQPGTVTRVLPRGIPISRFLPHGCAPVRSEASNRESLISAASGRWDALAHQALKPPRDGQSKL